MEWADIIGEGFYPPDDEDPERLTVKDIWEIGREFDETPEQYPPRSGEPGRVSL